MGQSYYLKKGSTHLPCFGCRTYQLIDPKPAKFEATADMRWFVGVHRNISKNLLNIPPTLDPQDVPVERDIVYFEDHSSSLESMRGHYIELVHRGE